MAVNPAWRRTPEGWVARFGEYVADPSAMGPRVAGIAFDYRRVAGALQVERQLDDVIRASKEDQAFVRRLAMTVLDLRVPISKRGDVAVERHGDHAGRFDVKSGGITPITNLARYWAIRAGLTENRTIERLRGAASIGTIPGALRDDLEESFRLFWRIRLEHHVMQVERGDAPDDFVDPGSLRPIPRRSLGEALRVVDAVQASLARDVGSR
jgi:CBS domain-containing protein